MAGLYLHVPFCRKACTYCNFHFSTSVKGRDEMVNSMVREMELRKGEVAEPVRTIYFGGGTPSILTIPQLVRLFDAAHKYFPIEANGEVTLEANPDDLDAGYLHELRDTPVNRLSIGVQSFYEEDLRYMNRAHSAAQSVEALKAAQDAGFSNISIDLIYGTPGLTDEKWLDNLARISEFSIPHFSSYALTVEEGTALHHSILNKGATPVDAAQSARQMGMLMDESARMGYQHYEISNLALPGRYAVHNTAYWQGAPYLGIGPSAHSFNGNNIRSWNVANNALYVAAIQRGELPSESEVLSDTERLNEYIMTSLRTMWGLDLEKVRKGWGMEAAVSIENESRLHRENGLLWRKEDKLVLTRAGKSFADRIASDVFQ